MATKPVGTWIPDSERDTRWWIWHKKFMCRVSNIQSMSVEYIRQFGMPSSGDPTYDQSTANEQVIRMLTINEMIEFYQQGVTVAVAKYADTKEIYERISDHLNAWKRELEVAYHTKNAPIDDLLLMDRFAMVVYRHAKHQFTTEVVDSILARRTTSVLRVSRDRILNSAAKTLVVNPDTGEKEAPKLPERVSMADVFAPRKSTPSGSPKWR